MTKIPLKGMHRVRAKGRYYYYAWRGGPRLDGEPGSREFLISWQAATQTKVSEGGRLSALIVEYKESSAFTRLADTTRKSWTPWLDRIRDGLGKLSVKTFDDPRSRQVIKKWRGQWKDTPRFADTGKQVLSAILSYAVEEGRLGSNPCFGIANLYSANRADLIWLPEDIAAIAATGRVEVTFALRLAALSGMRQADLLKLRWADVGDLAIVMKTGKGRGRLEYVVPIYAELRALFDEMRAYWRDRGVSALTVLATTEGRPWAGGFGSSWNKARIEAGITKLHFHDARGTAATKFFVAGFSPEEIAEIVGWEKSKVEGIIDRYVRRDALLKAKIAKMAAGG